MTKMQTIRLITALFLLGIFSPSYATLVDATPSQTGYTTIGGLDWLDLTSTDSMNYAAAASSFTQYRYATESEVVSLFNQAFGTLATDSSGWHYADSPSSTYNDGLAYISLLGHTHDNGIGNYGWYMDTGSVLRMAGAYKTSNTQVGILVPPNTGDYSSYLSSGHYNVGTFLVRANNSNYIPEPSAIALMGLGLLGFVATRRRIKK